MNENTVIDKIDIFMKDGRTYFGMLPVPGATNMQERLVVRFPEENCLLVLNWPDIGRVHLLGGK